MSVVDKEMWRKPNEHETGHAVQNGWVKHPALMHTERPSLINTLEDTVLFLLGIVAVACVAALIIAGLAIYL